MLANSEIKQRLPLSVLSVSFSFALLVSIIPLPAWAMWLRPELVALLVIYWMSIAPYTFGILAVWCIGLYVDILEGVVLGQNALSLTILAYLTFLLHTRLRMFSMLQQIFTVFILVGVYQLIGNWVHGIFGMRYYSVAFLLPALTSAIVWPLLQLFLHSFHTFDR